MEPKAATLEYAWTVAQSLSKWGRINFNLNLQVKTEKETRSITGEITNRSDRPPFYSSRNLLVIQDEKLPFRSSTVCLPYEFKDVYYDFILFTGSLLLCVLEYKGELREIDIKHTSQEAREKAKAEDRKAFHCHFVNSTTFDGATVKHSIDRHEPGIKVTLAVSEIPEIVEEQYSKQYTTCVRAPTIINKGYMKEYKILSDQGDFTFTLVLKKV